MKDEILKIIGKITIYISFNILVIIIFQLLYEFLITTGLESRLIYSVVTGGITGLLSMRLWDRL